MMQQTERRNTIGLTLGRKASGKSAYNRRRWTDAAPRLITLDYTGEAPEFDRNALLVYDMPGVLETFATLLRSPDIHRWHIIAQMPDGDVESLYGLLVPQDPRRPGIARAFGGVAIACDEVTFVAPLHGIPDPVRNALMIGRHHGLSQFYATQRPQNVSRAVSSQADYLTSFRMHEPRDRKFVAEAVGAVVATIVAELPRYHYVEYESDSGCVTIADGSDKVLLREDIGVLTRRAERGEDIGALLFANAKRQTDAHGGRAP